MTQAKWCRAFPLEELPVGQGRVFREQGQHIAVFRLGEEELCAVDNRCPHEGYPLSKGYVSDGVVTCPWHNFKFDLRDGRCVMGDEAVRTFPLRLSKGHVELDVAGLDAEEERRRFLASLHKGMLERKLGQVARDIVRLLQLGMSVTDVVFEAVRFDSQRAPWGSTHVLALAPDVISIAKRFDSVTAVLPLMQVFDQASEAHVRRAVRATLAPSVPVGDDDKTVGEQLVELAEAEKADEAEALLRGALDKGWGRETVEPWLFQACANHFLGFGHALIFQIKAFDLLDEVGWDRAGDVLPAHLVGIITATREEMVPEWLWFRDGTTVLFADLPAIYASSGRCRLEGSRLHDLLLDGDRKEMLVQLEAELRAGVRLEDIVDVLSAAAAARLLRFDARIDSDPEIQESWLGVTHILTYANALRYAVRRFAHPDVIKLIAYGARFVNNATGVDVSVDGREQLVVADEPADVASVMAAIAAGNAQRAVSLTLRFIEDSSDVVPLRDAFEDLALADVATRPIVVTHMIKTCRAAFDEQCHGGNTLAIVAVARWFALPGRERQVARAAHEAVRFVVHGKVPKKLS